jgi:tetratricopeptide (TPR) repeat protein
LFTVSLPVLAATTGGPSDATKSRAMDQFIRGNVADEMEDYYKAVYHYQLALQSDSTSAFIHVALAQDYILLGNSALATELLAKSLKLNPDYIPALELQAGLMRGMGKLKEARLALNKLVQLSPENSDYLRQQLSIELMLSDFDAADKIYQKIVAKEGASDLLDRQVLSVYLASGQRDRAILLLKKLAAADSTDPVIIYTLGSAYLQKGDTLSGEPLICKANQLDATEPRYWVARAVLAMDREQYTTVVQIVDSALTNVSPEAGLFTLKGVALNRMGDHNGDAVAALSKAVELDSTAVVAMGALALIYDGMDSVARAAELYEKAIALADSAPVYLNNLAYTYASRGLQLEKAKQLAAHAVKDEPKNSSYLDTMGWIEFGLGNHDEAIHWLKKALKQSPKSSIVLEHMGDVYAKQGDTKKAESFYRKALENDPTNENLRKKLAR